jgi:hypothetical protein
MLMDHARKIVWRRLDEARAIKRRMQAGTAFEWEGRRLSSLVQEARTYSRVARELNTPPTPLIPRSVSYQLALERAAKRKPN